jgi:hypothetical protein
MFRMRSSNPLLRRAAAKHLRQEIKANTHTFCIKASIVKPTTQAWKPQNFAAKKNQAYTFCITARTSHKNRHDCSHFARNCSTCALLPLLTYELLLINTRPNHEKIGPWYMGWPVAHIIWPGMIGNRTGPTRSTSQAMLGPSQQPVGRARHGPIRPSGLVFSFWLPGLCPAGTATPSSCRRPRDQVPTWCCAHRPTSVLPSIFGSPLGLLSSRCRHPALPSFVVLICRPGCLLLGCCSSSCAERPVLVVPIWISIRSQLDCVWIVAGEARLCF